MEQLYPLKLERKLSPRLWGGQRLQSFLALEKMPDSPEPFGESWQVYHENRIVNGAFAGQTLGVVAERFGEALLGTVSPKRYGHQVPLLAKFIDAADRLSIQVHPDDAYARAREAHTGHLGKTEAWYVLEAKPEASIIWGMKDRLSPEAFRQAIEAGDLETHVNVVPVRAGDVIYNPAGTLHAIGAGIFLFEIQQSSDLTYRVYDYQRRDASGKLRELHVDKAVEVVDLTPGERAKLSPEPLSEVRTSLVRGDFFALERWQVEGREDVATEPESFEILTAIEGELELSWAGGNLGFGRGVSLVLPASLGAYALQGRGVSLRCFVPASKGAL